MNNVVRNFVFGGILGSRSIQDFQAQGLLRDQAVGDTDKRLNDLFATVQGDIRTTSIFMQRQYRLLFVLENVVREFIASTLEDVDGSNWFEKRANKDMKRVVERRKDDEEKNQWHFGRNREPIFYLDFSHLHLLIKNNWSIFSDFFESQMWIESRLTEAERSRNVIAHTNILDVDEVQRLELYVRDILRQLG